MSGAICPYHVASSQLFGQVLSCTTKQSEISATVEQGSGETALPGREQAVEMCSQHEQPLKPCWYSTVTGKCQTGRRANANLLHPPRQIPAKPGQCRPTAYRYVNAKQILQEKTGILASSVQTPVTFPVSFAAYRIDSSL